jgi:hypothetical protein
MQGELPPSCSIQTMRVLLQVTLYTSEAVHAGSRQQALMYSLTCNANPVLGGLCH